MKALVLTTAALLTLPASGQVPNTLLLEVPPPPVGVQFNARMAYSVAVDGGYVVVGVPFDDVGGSDSGLVKVYDSASGALLHVIANPTPEDFDSFGISVGVSGALLVVGAQGDNAGADDAGSVYVYDLSGATPTVPLLVLNNPGPLANDRYGRAVAISGTHVVVGAHLDNTGATDAGSAYVYDLAGGSPTVPVLTLGNPSPAASDQFGVAMAISGTRVVVGAHQDDTGASDAGSVYVYDLAGGTPGTPVFTLNNPGAATSDRFGNAVAVAGTWVVVGTAEDDTGGTNAGTAYVYDLTSGTPTVPAHELSRAVIVAGDRFGTSAAISGSRVVVGAYLEDTGASGAGSAYVYDLSSGMPTLPVAVLNNPDAAANDNFGFAVAISGARVVAGADRDDTAGVDAGRAYVYDMSGGTPSVPVLTLTNAPGPVGGRRFGVDVAISGTRMVVGADGDGNGGMAHVYDFASATPSVPVVTLVNPGLPIDFFGGSVAISGTRVVVGADYDDTGYNNAGRVYVYDLTSGTPAVPVMTLDNPSPGVLSQHFGRDVAISGTWVVVGHPSNTVGGEEAAGTAYVYDLAGATPTLPVHTLNNPAPLVGDSFGQSVAIHGMTVVVGASGDAGTFADQGAAFVYDLGGATPGVPVLTLVNPTAQSGDIFGASVAVSGTRVVIGDPRDNTGATQTGQAYVYDLTSGTPAVPVVTLPNPEPGGLDNFGESVAASGPWVVIGARGDDTGAVDAGSVSVFDVTSATPTLPVATFNNPTPHAFDAFGRVAADGHLIAVGAFADSTVMDGTGYAYLYGAVDGDDDGLRDMWELSRFGTTTGHGPLDDHDKDGYVELLELAFGLNPTLSNSGGLPSVTQEGGYLTVTITKQPGVAYEAQTAGTLAPAQPDSFSAASTTVLIHDATTLKARDNFLMSGSERRFIRVRVTAEP